MFDVSCRYVSSYWRLQVDEVWLYLSIDQQTIWLNVEPWGIKETFRLNLEFQFLYVPLKRTKYSMSLALRCSCINFHLISWSSRLNFDKTFTNASAPSFLMILLANESDCNVLLVLKTWNAFIILLFFSIDFFYTSTLVWK